MIQDSFGMFLHDLEIINWFPVPSKQVQSFPSALSTKGSRFFIGGRGQWRGRFTVSLSLNWNHLTVQQVHHSSAVCRVCCGSWSCFQVLTPHPDCVPTLNPVWPSCPFRRSWSPRLSSRTVKDRFIRTVRMTSVHEPRNRVSLPPLFSLVSCVNSVLWWHQWLGNLSCKLTAWRVVSSRLTVLCSFCLDVSSLLSLWDLLVYTPAVSGLVVVMVTITVSGMFSGLPCMWCCPSTRRKIFYPWGVCLWGLQIFGLFRRRVPERNFLLNLHSCWTVVLNDSLCVVHQRLKLEWQWETILHVRNRSMASCGSTPKGRACSSVTGWCGGHSCRVRLNSLMQLTMKILYFTMSGIKKNCFRNGQNIWCCSPTLI